MRKWLANFPLQPSLITQPARVNHVQDVPLECPKIEIVKKCSGNGFGPSPRTCPKSCQKVPKTWSKKPPNFPNIVTKFIPDCVIIVLTRALAGALASGPGQDLGHGPWPRHWSWTLAAALGRCLWQRTLAMDLGRCPWPRPVAKVHGGGTGHGLWPRYQASKMEDLEFRHGQSKRIIPA